MRMPNERLSDVFGPRLFAFGFRSQSAVDCGRLVVQFASQCTFSRTDPSSRSRVRSHFDLESWLKIKDHKSTVFTRVQPLIGSVSYAFER